MPSMPNNLSLTELGEALDETVCEKPSKPAVAREPEVADDGYVYCTVVVSDPTDEEENNSSDHSNAPTAEGTPEKPSILKDAVEKAESLETLSSTGSTCSDRISSPMPKAKIQRPRFDRDRLASDASSASSCSTVESPGYHRRSHSDPMTTQSHGWWYQNPCPTPPEMMYPSQGFAVPTFTPEYQHLPPHAYQQQPFPHPGCHRRTYSDGDRFQQMSRCYNCDSFGHISKQCPFPCSFCRVPGHWSGICTFAPSKMAGKGQSDMGIKCFNCGMFGHRSVHCRESCQYCSQPGHWSGICPIRPDKHKVPAYQQMAAYQMQGHMMPHPDAMQQMQQMQQVPVEGEEGW
mmetsp:Transcript_4279/g.10152  ORF Transcript_4279/g.10152 Transcript_4279/m.10152 type:complete len:346 (+) Transcript_4279:72-1109(+)